MRWTIEDYRKTHKKYPNIMKLVDSHGHYYQARSSYGDISGMFKTQDDAIAYARKRNKTKTFQYKILRTRR